MIKLLLLAVLSTILCVNAGTYSQVGNCEATPGTWSHPYGDFNCSFALQHDFCTGDGEYGANWNETNDGVLGDQTDGSGNSAWSCYECGCTDAVTTEAEATTAAPSTDVGGEACKALDEAGCAAQPDSCRATNRGGKFRKCKPKRCKPLTETQCEAAVHCEKKMGRRGEYIKCRRSSPRPRTV